MNMFKNLMKKSEKMFSDNFKQQADQKSEKYLRECKIVLLGCKGSGKSTVIKQMKIVYQNGYAYDELLSFRPTVYSNLIDSAQALVEQMGKMGVEPQSASNKPHVERITEYRVEEDEAFILSEDIAQAIHELWQDPIIPKVMRRSSDFCLMDSAPYLFSESLRIGRPGYVPTEMDVLRAHKKSEDILVTPFRVGQIRINMIDVRGVRSECKKWIQCFKSVTSVIFMVPLSEYDRVLPEKDSQDLMSESILLFESVVNSRWFARSTIILFLNKMDIFRAKLPSLPLDHYFPDYTGGSDLNKAAKYIVWKFMQKNKERLPVYPHLTQATDPTNMRLTLTNIEDTIIQSIIRETDIL